MFSSQQTPSHPQHDEQSLNNQSAQMVPALQQGLSPASTATTGTFNTPNAGQQQAQGQVTQPQQGRVNQRYMKGRLPEGVDFAAYPGRSSTPLPTAESKSAERINQLKIWNEASRGDKRRLNGGKGKNMSLISSGGTTGAMRRTDSYKDAKDRHSNSFHTSQEQAHSTNLSNSNPYNHLAHSSLASSSSSNSQHHSNTHHTNLSPSSNSNLANQMGDSHAPQPYPGKLSKNEMFADREESSDEDEDDENADDLEHMNLVHVHPDDHVAMRHSFNHPTGHQDDNIVAPGYRPSNAASDIVGGGAMHHTNYPHLPSPQSNPHQAYEHHDMQMHPNHQPMPMLSNQPSHALPGPHEHGNMIPQHLAPMAHPIPQEMPQQMQHTNPNHIKSGAVYDSNANHTPPQPPPQPPKPAKACCVIM